MREAGKRAVTQLQTSTPNLLHLTTTTGNNATGSTLFRTGQEDHRGDTMAASGHDKLTILHYNDVYNIDATCKQEPIGGAARFVTAVRSFDHLNPLVLFSGDAFSPSMRELIEEGGGGDICGKMLTF